MIVDVMIIFVENSNDFTTKMFFEFKNFENVFFLKLSKIFACCTNVDHVIELKNDQQSFYNFLYNLSNSKLIILRDYLNDVLKRNIIRRSISLVETSMLFVSKKNEKLRFCVNYKDFNAIIRKNRHSLLLII